MKDDDECGAVGGIIGRENQRTLRKPTSVMVCPPYIPHDLTWARTRAAAVRIRHGMALKPTYVSKRKEYLVSKPSYYTVT
jgi:hypothetical protein